MDLRSEPTSNNGSRPDRRNARIGDAEARQLWRRAAELQEAAERTASVALSSDAGDSQLSLEHVAQAAEGAGIHADFVLMALAERRLPDGKEIRRESLPARWLRATVSETDAIDISLIIERPVPAVQHALHAVASQPPFNMVLENRLATSDRPQDGVLVYRLQGGSSHFNGAMNLADVRVLLVSLRDAEGGTRVRIRAPLYRRGINVGLSGLATAAGGLGGSWSGSTLASLVGGAVGLGVGSALLVPAALGALAGGVVALGGYRSLYRSLVRGGEDALRTFLTSTAMQAETSVAAITDSGRDAPQTG